MCDSINGIRLYDLEPETASLVYYLSRVFGFEYADSFAESWGYWILRNLNRELYEHGTNGAIYVQRIIDTFDILGKVPVSLSSVSNRPNCLLKPLRQTPGSNSCYSDATLFALFISPNNFIRTNMLESTVPGIGGIMCSDDPVRSDEIWKRIKSALIRIYNTMHRTERSVGREVITCTQLRDVMSRCQSQFESFSGNSMRESGEFLQFILGLFPTNVATKYTILIGSHNISTSRIERRIEERRNTIEDLPEESRRRQILEDEVVTLEGHLESRRDTDLDRDDENIIDYTIIPLEAGSIQNDATIIQAIEGNMLSGTDPIDIKEFLSTTEDDLVADWEAGYLRKIEITTMVDAPMVIFGLRRLQPLLDDSSSPRRINRNRNISRMDDDWGEEGKDWVWDEEGDEEADEEEWDEEWDFDDEIHAPRTIFLNRPVIPRQVLTLPSGRRLTLGAIVVYRGAHYTCYFRYGCSENSVNWYYYDDTGVDTSNQKWMDQPQGRRNDKILPIGKFSDMVSASGIGLPNPSTNGTEYYYVPFGNDFCPNNIFELLTRPVELHNTTLINAFGTVEDMLRQHQMLGMGHHVDDGIVARTQDTFRELINMITRTREDTDLEQIARTPDPTSFDTRDRQWTNTSAGYQISVTPEELVYHLREFDEDDALHDDLASSLIRMLNAASTHEIVLTEPELDRIIVDEENELIDDDERNAILALFAEYLADSDITEVTLDISSHPESEPPSEDDSQPPSPDDDGPPSPGPEPPSPDDDGPPSPGPEPPSPDDDGPPSPGPEPPSPDDSQPPSPDDDRPPSPRPEPPSPDDDRASSATRHRGQSYPVVTDMPDTLPVFRSVKIDTKSEPLKTTIQNIENDDQLTVAFIGRLGKSGKEGTTYKAKIAGQQGSKKSITVAVKALKNGKKPKPTEAEARFQMLVANLGLAPKVYAYIEPETGSKDNWQLQTLKFKLKDDKAASKGPKIMMEMMGQTIQQYIEDQPGNMLSEKDQYKLVAISIRLDQAGIYHNDPNPLNYMVTDGEFYFIDFGMTTYINKIKSKLPVAKYYPNLGALGTMLHGGMQGLVSRKILKGNTGIIDKYVKLRKEMNLTEDDIRKAFEEAD